MISKELIEKGTKTAEYTVNSLVTFGFIQECKDVLTGKKPNVLNYSNLITSTVTKYKRFIENSKEVETSVFKEMSKAVKTVLTNLFGNMITRIWSFIRDVIFDVGSVFVTSFFKISRFLVETAIKVSRHLLVLLVENPIAAGALAAALGVAYLLYKKPWRMKKEETVEAQQPVESEIKNWEQAAKPTTKEGTKKFGIEYEEAHKSWKESLETKGQQERDIVWAAKVVGVDKGLLLRIAKAESLGTTGTNAKNPLSSARGLFQFLTSDFTDKDGKYHESTWTTVVKKYGKDFKKYGGYEITMENQNPYDPKQSSFLAAHLLKECKEKYPSLKSSTDFYMVWFLGPRAEQFLKLFRKNPNTPNESFFKPLEFEQNPSIIKYKETLWHVYHKMLLKVSDAKDTQYDRQDYAEVEAPLVVTPKPVALVTTPAVAQNEKVVAFNSKETTKKQYSSPPSGSASISQPEVYRTQFGLYSTG